MRELHQWFLENQRDFPWRQERTPYKVWVSEVMLQQTRAAVVIPYFEKWLSLFPTIQALAEAPLEQVIKAWEGLGYYSRARNLHAGAQQIVSQFGGRFPEEKDLLQTIRGLGPYTIGAILSFGFQKKAAAVDGNVTRVLSRLFCVEQNVCKQATKRLIQQKAEEVLDEETPWITAEALIELGATICTPKPRCLECPLQKKCIGFQEKKAESLPIKDAEKEVTRLQRAVFVIEAEGSFLLRKQEKGRLMADLYELPYLEMGEERWPQALLLKKAKEAFGIELERIQKLPEVKQTFTRYLAHLYPVYGQIPRCEEIVDYRWVKQEELSSLPFSSGHRKIIAAWRQG